MSEGGLRRAVAEIRFGEDRAGLTKVGGRSIHQYWSLLSPHFRDVLLAPQRRSDDGGVAWTWREAADNKPLTAAELMSVRKRLERAKESFEENPVNPLMGDARSGTSSQVLIDQVAAKVKAMAESLSAKSDAALAVYVCRTETGPMVHSWGVATAAAVVYPDSLETGVSGVVLVGGKPSGGHEVVIENDKGLSVARMWSEEAGEFSFMKVGPGRYRLRVISGRVKFPAKGVMVTVERGAVSRLELRSTSDAKDPEESASEEGDGASAEAATDPSAQDSPVANSGRGWFGKLAIALLLLLLLAGGCVWAWRTWYSPDGAAKRVAVQTSSMAPEDFSNGAGKTNAGKFPGATIDDGRLGASADGVGSGPHRSGLRSGTANNRRISPTAGGVAHSPSAIGSKVEVLSGAADTKSSEERDGNTPTPQEATSAGAAGPESALEPAGSVPVSGAMTREDKPSPKRNQGTGAVGPSTTGSKSNGSGAHAGEAESVLVEDQKPLPNGGVTKGSVIVPAAKKAASAQLPGVVSTGEPPADGAATQDEAMTSDPVAESTPDDVTAATLGGGLPQEKAPLVKVSVANKSPDGGKPLPADDVVNSDDGANSAGKDASASNSPRSKKGKSAAGGGPKAPTGGSASTDGTQASAMSPERSTIPTNTAAGGASATKPANSAPSLNRAPPSGEGSVRADGTPAKGQKDNRTAVERGKAARARAPVAGSPKIANNRTTASAQKLVSDETPENAEAETPGEESQAVQSPVVNPKSDLQAVTRTTMGVIQLTGWEPRLVRDAIVPTMPTPAGTNDVADRLREEMLSERKTHVPETFKHPSTKRGFVFELSIPSKEGALYWQDSLNSGAVEKYAKENRAVITFDGEQRPPVGVHVLRFADGREAVQLTLSENGSLVLKLAEGVRSSLFLVVKGSLADEPDMAQSKVDLRFGWQVNGVARTRPKTPRNLVSEDQDYSISLLLELLKVSRWKVALTDRVTGWALVTYIQLQPAL